MQRIFRFLAKQSRSSWPNCQTSPKRGGVNDLRPHTSGQQERMREGVLGQGVTLVAVAHRESRAKRTPIGCARVNVAFRKMSRLASSRQYGDCRSGGW
jgi:hypothetical protein